jgi:hypothetical protein
VRGRARAGAPLVHDVAALERTALAWERTAVSLGAVGLLLLKVVDGGWATQAAGILLVAIAGLVVLAVVPMGYRRARARVDPGDPAAPFTTGDRWRPTFLLVTALAVSATGVALAVDVWVSGGP